MFSCFVHGHGVNESTRIQEVFMTDCVKYLEANFVILATTGNSAFFIVLVNRKTSLWSIENVMGHQMY